MRARCNVRSPEPFAARCVAEAPVQSIPVEPRLDERGKNDRMLVIAFIANGIAKIVFIYSPHACPLKVT